MSYFQTKLQWLCEELKERENREKSLRHQLMLCRQQLKNMTENKEAELQCLFEQIERQEQLLEEIHREKRGVLIALSLLFFFVYVHEILGLGEKYSVSLTFSLNYRISKCFSSPCLLFAYLHFWVWRENCFSLRISPLAPVSPLCTFLSIGHLEMLIR